MLGQWELSAEGLLTGSKRSRKRKVSEQGSDTRFQGIPMTKC